jgi:hypothetical protein
VRIRRKEAVLCVEIVQHRSFSRFAACAFLIAFGVALWPGRGVANVPGIPRGAKLISTAEWNSLRANGQLGPVQTNVVLRHAVRPPDEEIREPVPLLDGSVQTIHFLNDTELSNDITKNNTAFGSQPNQTAIFNVLKPFASTTVSIDGLGTDRIVIVNKQIAHDIASRDEAQRSKVWDKAPPSGSGCGTGVLGWGSGSDIGGNRRHIEYSDGGIYKNFDFPLKAFTPCVKDQAKRGTCTQFATLGAAEELIAEKYGTWTDLSEQATAAQDKIFWKPSLTGTESAGLLLANSQAGYVIPLESAWDYNGARHGVKTTPPGVPAGATVAHTCAGYHEYCSNTSGEGKYVCAPTSSHRASCAFATQVKSRHNGVQITQYVSLFEKTDLDGSFDLAKSFLSMGYPVIFEGDVKDHFNVKGGYIKPPSLGPHKRDGHAYNIVGFISNSKLAQKLPNAPPGEGGGYFIVRNSWGLGYGDRGFGYMPIVWAKKYVNTIFAIVDANLVN